MALLLNGGKVAGEIKKKLKAAIELLPIKPRLAIIQIGNDKRSSLYIKNKKAFGQSIGAKVRHLHIPETVTEKEMEKIIEALNKDALVHGIILQLPVPAHLYKEKLLTMVEPRKDVDGLSSDKPIHIPATARGVMTFLLAYNIPIKDKKVVVIGKSRLVGRPIAKSLKQAGAEVVTCDKSTLDIPKVTRSADLLVVAAGSPHLVTKDYVKPGQVIIDVGINPVTSEGGMVSHTAGDVDFPVVSQIVGAISPVPGGVGPLTVASLFENLFDAFQYCMQKGRV